MPASKRSHALAILRKNLGLRQPELAEMLGCSVATIQSIEVGRLKLSESLASRISAATGCDRDWLLRNDVSEPMPPRPFNMANVESTGLQTYVYKISFLIDVFSRLFAEVRKLDKTGARDQLELLLAKELKALKKTVKDPNARPIHSTSKENFQYFEEYPWELPDELHNLLDLSYLIEVSLPAPAGSQTRAEEEKKKTAPQKHAPDQEKWSLERRRKAPSRTRRSA
jgi:transcriptional regulator with XRE-family HTH domain